MGHEVADIPSFAEAHVVSGGLPYLICRVSLMSLIHSVKRTFVRCWVAEIFGCSAIGSQDLSTNVQAGR